MERNAVRKSIIFNSELSREGIIPIWNIPDRTARLSYSTTLRSKIDRSDIAAIIEQQIPTEEIPLGDIKVSAKAHFTWRLSEKANGHSLTILSPERTVVYGTEMTDYPAIKTDADTILKIKTALSKLALKSIS